METSILQFLPRFWWIWVPGGLAILWGISLVLVRRWTLKQCSAALNREVRFDAPHCRLPDLHPQDQEALRLLREYRRRYLLRLWPDTRFSFREINDLAQTLVTEIARIYYPEEERPELKASLADLVALYRRVGVRLTAWLETAPFRPLRDMELATVMLIHETYQKVVDNPVHQFLKRYHLYRAARWTWAAINIANPFYWGRQAAYRSSREFLARVFLAKVVTVVGEEAMRLYSRRSLNLHVFRRCQVGVQEMINLAMGQNGTLPAEVILTLLKSVLKVKGLEDQEKVALLRRLSHPHTRDTGLAELTSAEQKEVHEWLQGLVKTCWRGPERRQLLNMVQARWQEIGTKSEA
jgi:hypothetical protein|uniref:Uncharacterized protein n=1 Tax=Desulfobacca acetoxidans TaxID=60893 RepID=A0A7V6A3B2_9BACT